MQYQICLYSYAGNVDLHFKLNLYYRFHSVCSNLGNSNMTNGTTEVSSRFGNASTNISSVYSGM